MGARRGAASAGGAGFTLVEVLVVIAMVGVLSAVALVFVRPGSLAAGARGYADEIAALCDAVRQRAVASRTYQRIDVDEDGVVHWQAAQPGLAPPEEADDWAASPSGRTAAPPQIGVRALSNRAHAEPDDGVPGPGAGLPGSIAFSPDGTAFALDGTRSGATIFIEDSHTGTRARVAVYPATGSAYAYSEW